MRPISLTLIAAIWVAASAAPRTAPQEKWTLIWNDEFNGPRFSAPDPAKWDYDLGGGGWGNRELENYTRQRDNVFVDGRGHLAISAVRTESGTYTSGRLKTRDRFEVQYGKIEAKIKVPFGPGIWPAFWMLGNNISGIGWPKCGEIDIMENIGKEPSTVHGTLHGPGYSGAHGISASYALPTGRRFAEKFHVFAAEWSPEAIRFFVDGRNYAEVTPAKLPGNTSWVYDHPFFLLLNLAVGGDWPGPPDSSTIFPQTMLVDWVRVWQRN